MPQECTNVTKNINIAFAVLCFMSPLQILETLRVSYEIVKSAHNVQDTVLFLILSRVYKFVAILLIFDVPKNSVSVFLRYIPASGGQDTIVAWPASLQESSKQSFK